MVRVFNFVEQFPAISVGRFKNKRLRKVFLGLDTYIFLNELLPRFISRFNQI